MKIKVLFIAIAHSSHTISWIELFNDSFIDAYIYGIQNTKYPENIPCFNYEDYIRIENSSLLKRFIKKINRHTLKNRFIESYSESDYMKSIIKKIKPDIIHTLGFDSAGYEFVKIVDSCRSFCDFAWVHTSRGSELSLKGYLPENLNKEVLDKCDGFIADSNLHYQLAIKLGLDKSKIPFFGFVPGSGGIDIEEIRANALFPVSQRDRIILWPKAYECQFSKALPVYEALKIAWDKIKPCKIIMTAMIPETQIWFNYLPDEIKNSSIRYERIPRDELLNFMKRARVLLAPTLSDGIPNSFYEAMGAGAVPIISSLDTYSDIIINKKNAIFARNLYPEEIAEALVLAMNDNELVDYISSENIKLLQKMGNRSNIRKKLLDYYNSLIA